MLQATLIYNPQAGPANLAAVTTLIADSWQARGWDVTIKPTQFAGHATDLARAAAAAGHQLALVAGGDGTLGEAVNGLAGSETALGLLPMGTGNSLAKEFLMPRPTRWDKHKLLQASDALAAGRVQRIDVGITVDEAGGNGRFWALWAGVGADGFLVDQLEPRPKWSKSLGVVGYALQGLTVMPKMPFTQATVEIDGRFYQDEYALVLVSNCQRYAGGEVLLSPQAKLDDGLFEVWFFRGNGMARILRHLVDIKRGRHLNGGDIEMVNGRSITIHTNPSLPAQLDGERAGHSPLSCKIQPGALRLLVPSTAPPDLFSLPGESLIE